MRIPAKIRLQLGGSQVIDVIVAVITAEGEINMNENPEKKVAHTGPRGAVQG
jgi:hypothetical protein